MTKQADRDIFIKLKEQQILKDSDFNRDKFPNLWNLSSGYFFGHLPIPKEKKKPEFVFIKNYENGKQLHAEKEVTIAEWNMIWEVGHLRTDFFWQKLPKELEWLKNYEGENIYLVPDHKDFLHQTYSPLFHLLPYKVRKQFRLPLLKKGNWPFITDYQSHLLDDIFKINFESQLSKAFAHHIWPLLDSQSNLQSYANNDSITLLAHNLKFWLPSMYSVLEEEILNFGRIEPKSVEQVNRIAILQSQYPELDIKMPLKGGNIWTGEDEAWHFTKRLVKHADSNGQLRGIIDAVRTNRIQDDFSEKWSYAKEDFERKLYSKRSKVKVNFVELNECVAIHSQTSELDNNYLWDDLLSIIDNKERRVVVLLRKGITNHQDISELLGYKNHSPVTKTLKRIRKKAAIQLDIKPRVKK